jgi:hypothetical protein
MRKFKIKINNVWQTIFAENEKTALGLAKINLGYKETDVLINWSLEFFNGIEDLIKRCEKTRAIKSNKTCEIVESWGKPDKKREYGCSLEILREDNYYDKICFEWEQDELADNIYNQLEKFNTKPSILEKYQASF